MSEMKKLLLLIFVLSFSGLAHGQCNVSGNGNIGGVGQFQCGLGFIVAGLENSYCTIGSGVEKTEGAPLWGATDDLATLPTQCIYTGSEATPSFGNTYTIAATTNLTNLLASANGGPPVDSSGNLSGTKNLSCGDIISLTAGATFTGEFVFPTLTCDGAHWIRVQTSKVTDANFPGEGVRATPCIAGLSNDSVNGFQEPGYPYYPCPSFGTTLSAKIIQPGNNNSAAASFASGANHYRFIGIEFAQSATNSVSRVVKLQADGKTLGVNHIIFDRVLVHGRQWTPSADTTNESTGGINAKNSQWISLINSWDYDTYCNASCVDSQAFAGGTGLYQDGPFKVYNNLLSSAGETMMFGGGGQGSGTPNTSDFEIRSNYSMKPLTWMVVIGKCAYYRQAVTKNLFELKNGVSGLIEGNVFADVWQGCQSDQNGTAFKLNPANQNNHQQMRVDFSGTNIVSAGLECLSGSNSGNSCTTNADCGGATCGRQSFVHHNTSSALAGNPADAANCPPSGCVLNDINNKIDYRLCNGANGCDQSGVPNLQCGTGSKAGQACTTDGQCTSSDGTQSYCAPSTTARVACGLPGQPACPSATPGVLSNACVPGDCPSCKNKNVTVRYNEISNATGGFSVNTGLSSICHDQANGMDHVSIHDNYLHGLSREMVNGVDPYSDATCFTLSNNAVPPGTINYVAIRHNTCAVEQGNANNTGSFLNQVDHSDIQYLQGLAYTDNVSPGAASMSRSAGTGVTKGIGGAAGLANTYAVNSCQRYFTDQALTGTIGTAGTQNFTFAGLPSGGTNYLVSLNGQWTAITSPAATSFTVTAATKVNDTIVVRDLNDCDWTFASNLIGIGTSNPPLAPYGQPIAPSFIGAGKDSSPYPNFISGVTSPYKCGAGGTLDCILNESNVGPGTGQGTFINNFVSWGTGRSGNYAIKATSQFFNAASDSLTRPATGRSPGADFTLLAAKTAGVRGDVPASCGAGNALVGTTCMPALSITTTSLPTGTHCNVVASCGAYNASLASSFGASQFWSGYKSWWLETDPTLCGGSCGSLNNGTVHSGLMIGRDGVVGGPFAVLNVSRTGCPAACLSTYTVTETLTGGIWEVNQIASMSQFIDSGTCSSGSPTKCDSSFNGKCQITSILANGNGFSCQQAGDIAGTNFNVGSHKPSGPTGPANGCGVANNSNCDSLASFAPISAGTYTFWVGVKDGAFQVARRQITVTVN